MGYYLPRKSYLRPTPRARTTQKFVAVTTLSITLIAVAIILPMLQLSDTTTATANTKTEVSASEVAVKNQAVISVVEERVPTTTSAMPVEMAFFKANSKPSVVELKWSTISELNNGYFQIQKSFNGGAFTEIGCVDGGGKGTTSADYSFVDVNPGDGLIFYRLRQTGLDGKSNFIALDNVMRRSDARDMGLFINQAGPEPFVNSFYVNYYTEREGSVAVELFDKNGKNVFKSYTTATKGFNTCRYMSGDELEAGEYTLKISNSLGVNMRKVKKATSI